MKVIVKDLEENILYENSNDNIGFIYIEEDNLDITKFKDNYGDSKLSNNISTINIFRLKNE